MPSLCHEDDRETLTRELLADSLEELLDSGAVTDEGSRHLESTGRNVTNGSLDVVGDPVNEVGGVLVLHGHHLVIDLAHAHASTEHGSDSEVTTVTGAARGHHVLGIEHLERELCSVSNSNRKNEKVQYLLREFGNSQSSVGLSSLGRERGESRHEEVETGEGNHIDGQLAKVSVQLSGESEAGGDSRHRHRNCNHIVTKFRRRGCFEQ